MAGQGERRGVVMQGGLGQSVSQCVYTQMYVCMYVHTHMYMYVYAYLDLVPADVRVGVAALRHEPHGGALIRIRVG